MNNDLAAGISPISNKDKSSSNKLLFCTSVILSGYAEVPSSIRFLAQRFGEWFTPLKQISTAASKATLFTFPSRSIVTSHSTETRICADNPEFETVVLSFMKPNTLSLV